jgi:hypothetical protein
MRFFEPNEGRGIMRDMIDMAREAGADTLMYWDIEKLKRFEALVRADERTRMEHNNEVLMNALWKACGDDEEIVKSTIESQGEIL